MVSKLNSPTSSMDTLESSTMNDTAPPVESDSSRCGILKSVYQKERFLSISFRGPSQLCLGSMLSLLCIVSLFSLLSINSMLSILSVNSLLSIASVNSVLSIGCISTNYTICVWSEVATDSNVESGDYGYEDGLYDAIVLMSGNENDYYA
eukprot:GHVH01009321.1.p1 GENE.GHVH01009321.1~~GHVH01009321.1.p1  ORF type:complete len:150 (+),score=13.84 GHVH01009321.1:185-634(+)